MQNKDQFDLDRETATISVLLSGNAGKFEFLTGKDFLAEKGLLEKATTIKIFEYSDLGSELQKQNGISKGQYKLLKRPKNNVIDNKREDGDDRDEEMSDKSNVAKTFCAILEDIKNNTKTTMPVSVKSHGSNINLYLLIRKLQNAEKVVLRKDYGFDEAFNIFDEINDKRIILYE